MSMGRSFPLIALLLLMLAGASWADTVFLVEPETQIRPRPGLRLKPIAKLPWGTRLERVKEVGPWSRITWSDSADVFVWTEWAATYDVVEAKTVAENRREVYFTVGKYMAKPVLEAMCADVLETQKAEAPTLKGLRVKGYLAGDYPGGNPLCTAEWAGGSFEIRAPDDGPVTPREEEIHDWVSRLFRSADRSGQSIYAVGEVWEQTAKHFEISIARARYAYDRVRWLRAGMLEQ